MTHLDATLHQNDRATRWLAAMLSHAPAAMALLRGPEHVIVLANATFLRALDGDTAIGRPLADVLPELREQGYIELLDKALETGEPQRRDAGPVSVRIEGRRIDAFIDLICEPILDASGAVEAITIVAVDVTERVRNRAQADRSLAVLGGQKDVLERIVEGEPLPVVLDSLVRMVEQWSDGVLASILLLADDGEHLVHGAAPSLPAEYNAAIDGIAIGPNVGSCGTAAYRREQVIVTDIASDPLWGDFRELALAHRLRACWSTPIVAAGGALLGTFAMYYREPRTPGADDLALIDVLVRTAAVGIARSRNDADRERALADERRARAALLRAHADLNFVLDVTTQVASSLDYEDTLELLAQLAVPTLADICLIDVAEGSQIRRAAAAAHRPAHQVMTANLERFAPDPLGSHPAASVLETGEPQFAEEMTDEFLRATCRDDEHYQTVRTLGFESYITVPLEARGRVFGALTLVSAGSGRRYGAHDLSVAQDLARRAALAIDNIRLYQSARDAEQRLSLVARTGAALTSSLDLDTVIERLGRLLLGEVADICEIHYLGVDGQWWRRTFDGGDAHAPAGDPWPSAVQLALAQRAPVRLPAADLAEVFAEQDGYTDSEAAVVMPLLARGETIGTIAVAVTTGARRDRVQLDVLDVLAGRAALAIDNARLFEQERGAAEVLQRSLLPRQLPAIANIEAAARYQPGGPRSEVGGDWYDLIRQPDGRVGLVMGDVMGRGIPAASVMGQLRNGLRVMALENREPAHVLDLLSRLLGSDPDSPLATLFYAVIDPVSRRATVANAGHVPPLLLTGAAANFLEIAEHPPLGVPSGQPYGQEEIVLPAHAVLVLYTDGLIERRDRPLTDGLAALARSARQVRTTDPDRLCDHLLQSLTGDNADEDDTAILAVHFRG
jgi:GAF domain-containing protein